MHLLNENGRHWYVAAILAADDVRRPIECVFEVYDPCQRQHYERH